MTGDIRPYSRAATAIGLAALLTIAAGSRQAQAYALEGPVWATGTAKFAYIVPGTSGSGYSYALKQAMADWNAVSNFKWAPQGVSANPCANTGLAGARLSSTACGQTFGSSTLAVTFYNYGFANHFIHVGTVFNSHVKFGVYSGALMSGSTDFRRVAVHELGHALGLDHENNSGIPAIMAPTVSNIQKPQPDDINGTRAMYGP